MNPFPTTLWSRGPLVLTDTLLTTVLVSLILVAGLRYSLSRASMRVAVELVYEVLERQILEMTAVDVKPLMPLILTQWLFIGGANLVGLIPGLSSPTRDLSLSAALAVIAFVAGHAYAYRKLGVRYLRGYIEPSPLLLPFNVIGELSRTVAMALRLFGNMMSGALVGAIAVYLAGLLVPVPLLLLSVLTAVVQAYIFGVLTLVFAASAVSSGSLRLENPPERGEP